MRQRSYLRSILCTCGLLLVAGWSGCSKRAEPADASARILRLSQRNEPADLDPALASLPDEFFIIRALSEGLVTPEPIATAGAVRPAAAERWDISADGLTYTFHLRPGARWSNGEPVTADDFVASYRRLLTPATGAPKAALFFMVKNARAFATGATADFAAVGIHATDAATLVITLAHPMPQFLLYVASGPWIPVNPGAVARHGRAWTRPDNFVGNGPFTLAEWRPHQRITVRRNPGYHAAADVKLDEIRFLTFDSGDTEERAYRAGQVDITMAVPANKLATHARERPTELHRAGLAETRYLAFNTTRPPLNDRRVRRALALAIDRRKIVDGVLQGGSDPAYRLVPPALSTLAERDLSSDGESPGEARQLLAEAGYPDGNGFPHLELSSWPTTPVTEAVQAMWRKELGITVSLVTREAKVHIAALHDGAFDIGYMTAIPDVPDAADLLADFTSANPGNYPHWSDARYDELVTTAASAGDATERAALLAEAEERLLEECPLTPLYFNSRNWLMSPRVRGWQHDALWTRFYLNVELSGR